MQADAVRILRLRKKGNGTIRRCIHFIEPVAEQCELVGDIFFRRRRRTCKPDITPCDPVAFAGNPVDLVYFALKKGALCCQTVLMLGCPHFEKNFGTGEVSLAEHNIFFRQPRGAFRYIIHKIPPFTELTFSECPIYPQFNIR